MRTFLVAALVLASLFFSVGGVALSSRAGSTDQSLASGNQCAAPMPPADPRISAAQIVHNDDVIELNTRGYNYAGPGEIQMDPTRLVPSSAQPPASPAKP
jgi:hypothetical protein